VEDEQPHVKVTMNTLYKMQLDNQKLLVETIAKLELMTDVPERVRSIELKLARTEWIERVAYVALAAGVSALVGMIIGAGQ
jgi:hypothetical protein